MHAISFDTEHVLRLPRHWGISQLVSRNTLKGRCEVPCLQVKGRLASGGAHICWRMAILWSVKGGQEDGANGATSWWGWACCRNDGSHINLSWRLWSSPLLEPGLEVSCGLKLLEVVTVAVSHPVVCGVGRGKASWRHLGARVLHN